VADWAAKVLEAARAAAQGARALGLAYLALAFSIVSIVFTAATCRKFDKRERSRQ